MGKPKSLAMRKMEKNFIAHLEKKYPRKPYSKYSMGFFIKRIREETHELEGAILAGDFENALEECGDISNLVDFLFERLTIVVEHNKYANLELKIALDIARKVQKNVGSQKKE